MRILVLDSHHFRQTCWENLPEGTFPVGAGTIREARLLLKHYGYDQFDLILIGEQTDSTIDSFTNLLYLIDEINHSKFHGTMVAVTNVKFHGEQMVSWGCNYCESKQFASEGISAVINRILAA